MMLKRPIMGWNTWNTFGEKINEELIMQTADAMVELGYRDAGYEYVIIDDCWSAKERDGEKRLVADSVKFPHGMRYLADYVHARGLKFGMYSDCGFWTCAGYPGSFGYEYADAETFADWGVDYLKYDYDYFPESADTKNAYLTMAQALRRTGRDIVLAACNWGALEPWNWMRSRGADTYRSTHDISDRRQSFIEIFRSQWGNFAQNGGGCYNDLDMLTVGMYGNGNVGRGGCSYEDYVMQFAIWAFMGAPLIIGGDVRNMDEACRQLLQNRALIGINQDADNRPPFKVNSYWDECFTLARLLEGGDMAVAAFNFHDKLIDGAPLSFDDLGIRSNSGYGVILTNVLTGETRGPLVGGTNLVLDEGGFVLYRAKTVKL
jgi:alpha-galactosidase